jgi:hypothetical protein
MKKTILSLIIIAVVFASCINSFRVVDSPQPNCRVKFTDGSFLYNCELIAAADTGIVLKKYNIIYMVKFDEMYDLKINGICNRDAKIIMLTPIVFFDGLFAVLTSQVPEIAACFVIHGVGAYTSMALDVPKTQFTPPLTEKHLDQLKLYARYPQGLTEEQLKELLSSCGQETLLKYIHGSESE